VETGPALRETSDALLRDLDVLATMEEEKRTLDPADPRLSELAARVEEVARRVLSGSSRQHDLTRVARAQVRAGSPKAPKLPIEETARAVGTVLADWREAERRAAAAEPGSPEHAEASALVRALRDEYGRAYEARKQNQ
jgi:hypothetical protein